MNIKPYKRSMYWRPYKRALLETLDLAKKLSVSIALTAFIFASLWVLFMGLDALINY